MSRPTYHLQLKPGTNVAVITALAHVVVTEGLLAADYIAERCDDKSFQQWKAFVARPENSPEAMAAVCGVPADQLRGAARLYAQPGNSAIYYGLGVTEHAQGSTMVMGIANLAMATGNVGREGVGVNPLRGQNNVQGSCDMGSFPHELPGYRHISDSTVRSQFEAPGAWQLNPEPGLRIPNMFDAALSGSFKGLYCQGEDIVQSDPNTQHVAAAMMAMECVVVQDIFLNETAKYAHVFLPGASFLEKDGTFTNAERRISRVRRSCRRWPACRLGGDAAAVQRAGLPHALQPPQRNHGRDRGADAQLCRGDLRKDRPPGQRAMALQRQHRRSRHAIMHRARLCARQGPLHHHAVRGQRRKGHAPLPAAADHRAHPEPVQRGRADPAHRPTASGTARTGWKSTRTTRRSAASRTATGSASRAARARRCCART
jgi:anaerobic selenocysteine-containing dehydrogenase